MTITSLTGFLILMPRRSRATRTISIKATMRLMQRSTAALRTVRQHQVVDGIVGMHARWQRRAQELVDEFGQETA